MVRVVVSLEETDKRWLEECAEAEGVSMTEIVRRAVRRLREQTRRRQPGLEERLEETAGIWRRGDGLEYQKRARREW